MPDYRLHNAMTEPGSHAPALARLSDDIPSLVAIVRGHFVHGDFLPLYGLDDPQAAASSRETLSLQSRLDEILELNEDDLAKARSYKECQVGTCRDYALMTCGLLREKRIPARVRCGFATYFVPGRFEDHWICEIWQEADKRWRQIDAQLDASHCAHLKISFDTTDLPPGAFLNAEKAWRAAKYQDSDPSLFGHGRACGPWFLWVNLARDYLSLGGQETSPWDAWRRAMNPEGAGPSLSPGDFAACDRLADAIREMDEGQAGTRADLQPQPFWI